MVDYVFSNVLQVVRVYHGRWIWVDRHEGSFLLRLVNMTVVDIIVGVYWLVDLKDRGY